VRLLAIALLLLGCEQPCALVCNSDADCVQQGALPGYYCVNSSVCLPDCYKCNGGCVETVSNCGACGHACAAGQVCFQGACAPDCGAGFSNCAGSCYDLANDRVHCGACDHGCGRNETCVGNACTQSICG
jgi:hypothetical protein